MSKAALPAAITANPRIPSSPPSDMDPQPQEPHPQPQPLPPLVSPPPGSAARSSSSSSPSPSHSSPSPCPTRGLPLWEQRRAEWIAGHKPYSQNTRAATDQWAKDNPALVDVDQSHFDAIYKSMVDGRRFAKPVPLPFVVAVLVHGWKKEGLWAPATGIGSAYPDDRPASQGTP
ncbi:hypothetical protein HDU86_006535 [Geranomyces michiganensis]|nr:hypothetical protein HDU86_006535 [Geranomyces michiganensis]